MIIEKMEGAILDERNSLNSGLNGTAEIKYLVIVDSVPGMLYCTPDKSAVQYNMMRTAA